MSKTKSFLMAISFAVLSCSVGGKVFAMGEALKIYGAVKLIDSVFGEEKKAVEKEEPSIRFFISRSDFTIKEDDPELIKLVKSFVKSDWKKNYSEEFEQTRRNIKDLMERDFEVVSQQDKTMETALHWAAYIGNKSVVDIICQFARKKGVENEVVNARDKSGFTPLARAIQAGYSFLIPVLVSFGANVKIASYAGTTPLHLAVRDCSTDACFLLLRLGADPVAKDSANHTPFYFCSDDEIDAYLDDNDEDTVEDLKWIKFLLYSYYYKNKKNPWAWFNRNILRYKVR